MKSVARMVMLGVMFALCTTGPVAQGDDGADGKTELQRIKQEMSEKKRKLKKADRKERSILSELEKIDRDIQTGSAELADQRKKLAEAESALHDGEVKNAAINQELAALKLQYGQRLRALYKMERSGYAAAMIVSDSPGSAIKRIKYLGVIAGRDRTLISEYGSALERLAVQQAETAQKKQDIVARKRSVESMRTELEAKKQQKSTVLGGVRREKGLYEQTLRELEETSVSLWAMIRKDEQERAAQAALAPAGTMHTPGVDRNRLSWPLEGQVLTRFGSQHHPQFGTMVFRRGIEIEAREGAQVRAVEGGQVAYADWYKGYGKLVILDHGNGFFTLYGNLSQLDVVREARVAKGQIVGLAGETGSMKGSKLYFEIRRNGEAQDPLAWLAKK